MRSGSSAFRPEKPLMSSRLGPEEMNSRPHRPSSSQVSSEARLPVFRGAMGGPVSGAISLSYSPKEIAAARSPARKRRPLPMNQKSDATATTPIALDSLLGRNRLILDS